MTVRRIALVAGAGQLPGLVVEAALAAGSELCVFALAPLALPAGVRVRPARIDDPAALIWAIREEGPTDLVLAGAVSIPEAQRSAIAAALGGSSTATTDVALSSLAGQLQRLTGARLVGPHELLPHLLAPAGRIAGAPLDGHREAAARFAVDAARAVGRLDLGQAAVTTGTRLLAAEDVAGTDALLIRIGAYRAEGLLGEAALVLGKAAKPQQPLLIDLPTIGPDTVSAAAAAGIDLIAVEARRTLVLDIDELRRRAAAAGVSVVALDG